MNTTRIISTIDTYTAGQPTRTVIGGIAEIPGATMGEKALYMKENLDHIRQLLMFEPRGSDIMSGVIQTASTRPDCNIGVIFIEVGGYLPMCGHDLIGVCTALTATGMIAAKEPATEIRLDTPAGPVSAMVNIENGKAKSVTFENIPSFVFAYDKTIHVRGVGEVTLDISYGGCFYAIINASSIGVEIVASQIKNIVQTGNLIREELNRQVKVYHPEKEFINEVTHVQFVQDLQNGRTKNVVVIPDGSVDRSPCGTGSSARLANLYRKKELKTGEVIVNESIIGTEFKCRIKDVVKVGQFEAVIPEITGSAYVTGLHTFMLDPEDPFPAGFHLG